MTRLVRSRVVPSALELIDGDCLEAVAGYLGTRALAPEGTAALLLIEVDGLEALVAEEADRVEQACRQAGATDVLRAHDPDDRHELWRVRRELSPSLKTIAPLKFNHDVVVPKGRIPELFELVASLKAQVLAPYPVFRPRGRRQHPRQHHGVAGGRGRDPSRARGGTRALQRGRGLGGAISGEHGIGFTKAPYLGLERSADELALMRRLKQAFDPHGILNPGKIFPPDAEEDSGRQIGNR